LEDEVEAILEVECTVEGNVASLVVIVVAATPVVGTIVVVDISTITVVTVEVVAGLCVLAVDAVEEGTAEVTIVTVLGVEEVVITKVDLSKPFVVLAKSSRVEDAEGIVVGKAVLVMGTLDVVAGNTPSKFLGPLKDECFVVSKVDFIWLWVWRISGRCFSSFLRRVAEIGDLVVLGVKGVVFTDTLGTKVDLSKPFVVLAETA